MDKPSTSKASLEFANVLKAVFPNLLTAKFCVQLLFYLL